MPSAQTTQPYGIPAHRHPVPAEMSQRGLQTQNKPKLLKQATMPSGPPPPLSLGLQTCLEMGVPQCEHVNWLGSRGTAEATLPTPADLMETEPLDAWLRPGLSVPIGGLCRTMARQLAVATCTLSQGHRGFPGQKYLLQNNIAQAGLERGAIMLPQPSECWEDRGALVP